MRGQTTTGAPAWWTAIGVWVGAMALAAPAAAQDLDTRNELRRSLREYLFFNAQLGFRQQSAVYAEDATEGPSGRSEFRFHLNGRYATAPTGGLGAYVGLGVVGRFGGNGGVADPMFSPYDEFEAQQNLRLYGAHVQYKLRGEPTGLSFLVQAGRMSDFDDRARLLMYDGVNGEVSIGRNLAFGIYGGRRATLDSNFADDRTDLGAQLVSGVYARAKWQTLSIKLSHRFEEVQQAGLRVAWDPMTELGLALGAQMVFGGDSARTTDRELTGLQTSALPYAVILRFDGDYASPSGRTAVYLVSEAQVGVDPRVYGRAGRGPGDADVDAALRVSMNQARLDRLFIGPGQPHVLAEVGFEHWVAERLGLRAGGFARVPLGDAAIRSLQPRIIEGWAGPELGTASGDRVALELRLASEDPGTADRIFVSQGDGERQYGVLRAFAEVPLRLSPGWALTLRPEFEATLWDSAGPLATADNQLAVYGGLLTSLRAGPDFRAALRYGAGTQPDFSAYGVRLIHDVELWVSGAF